MQKIFQVLIIVSIVSSLVSCDSQQAAEKADTDHSHAALAAEAFPVRRSETDWQKLLSPEAFAVLRKEGTERAFSGKYHNLKKDGIYYCAACGNRLFDSKHKYDSGTGWPSYYKPIESGRVATKDDYSFFGTQRTEVHCARCGGHLGHVFDDGPAPTGLRYCMNSVSLQFKGRQEAPPPLLK